MFNKTNTDGTSIKSPVTFKSLIKFTGSVVGDEIQVATITLKDYIYAIRNGFLLNYQNNRGTGRTNGSRVRNIAENYDANKLGVITIADWNDGTFMKADAHHRTAAILMKADGVLVKTFTQEELNQELSLHVIVKEHFIRVYSGLNNSIGHGTKAKVLNRDLGIGSLLDDVFNLLTVTSYIQDKFHTAIARCIFGHLGQFGKAQELLTYADISKDRKVVSEAAAISKEEFNIALTNKQKHDVASALDYVNSVYREFESLNNLSKNNKSVKLNQTARSILRNASLFGFLFWDKLSGREEVTDLKPKNLALRITEKDAQIERQAKFLLNSELREAAADKIIEYIKTKKRV